MASYHSIIATTMYIKFALGIAITGDSRNFVEWFPKQL